MEVLIIYCSIGEHVGLGKSTVCEVSCANMLNASFNLVDFITDIFLSMSL